MDAGQCRLTVCPCSDDICQLRLDFQSFIINQPEGVNTVSVAKVGGKEMYDNTQCQTDIFSVTAPGNNAPPVICGTNTGEHSKKWKITLNFSIPNSIFHDLKYYAISICFLCSVHGCIRYV